MAYMGFLCSKKGILHLISSSLTDYDKTMIPYRIEKKEENVLDVMPCDILSLFSSAWNPSLS